MDRAYSLNNKYSTTRLIIDKEPKIINKPEDKFQSFLFFPKNPERKGEGGLRTKGHFKYSYKIENNKWYACNWEGDKLFEIEIPKDLKDLSLLSELKDKEGTIELPLVTVITVVLNGAKYLEDTIQSVIGQTYPNVEYIVIDGGSTDGTLDIIRKYEEYIDYWISEPDKGIYDAMNKGIQLAGGRVVGILNSDDYYYPKSIEYIIKYFGEKYDFVFGSIKYENKIVSDYRPKKLWYSLQVFPSHSAGFFIKMKIHKEMGLYDLRYSLSSDYDFIYNIINKGYKGTCTRKEELTGVFRKGGVSGKNIVNNLFEEFKIRKAHKESILKITILILLKFFKNFNKIKIVKNS